MSNNINRYKYLLVYQVPLVVVFSILSQSAWSFFALYYIFGLLPLLELFTKTSSTNLSETQETKVSKDLFYDIILWSLVPIHFFVGGLYVYQMLNNQVGFTYQIGATIAYGLSCGVLGINAAHELGNRQTWYEQLMSKALLLTTLYMQFIIAHNRGHHQYVSTPLDPSSARYGESLYAFIVRSIFGSWRMAWQLERKKLTTEKKPVWGWQNEMLRFVVIQLGFLGLLVVCFGLKIFVYYGVAALIGVLLLETVNYIEHYGLTRQAKGIRFERVMPCHSWNSNHPIGRLVLLELSRHSDHHFKANRKYQLLRHFDQSPQMPTGYPGMMLLALFPPLWFWVMHKRIFDVNQQQLLF